MEINEERAEVFIEAHSKGFAPFIESLEEEAKQHEIPIIRKGTQELLRFLLCMKKPKNVLEKNFASIASSASTTQANRIINETLTLFASNNVPVLIIISQAGGFNDYDRPTTIEDYLNYLKDQKVNRNSVYNLKLNDDGKITEVELIKK